MHQKSWHPRGSSTSLMVCRVVHLASSYTKILQIFLKIYQQKYNYNFLHYHTNTYPFSEITYKKLEKLVSERKCKVVKPMQDIPYPPPVGLLLFF